MISLINGNSGLKANEDENSFKKEKYKKEWVEKSSRNINFFLGALY